jgi:hypothetical protein
MPTHYHQGIYFIAFGKNYVEEATHCAQSIKKISSLPIAIACDSIADSSQFDIVYRIQPKHIRTKVDYLENTPFEHTLYLDSDTEVCEDLTENFRLLEKYDVCMTHDFARKRDRWSSRIPEYNAIPDGFSEFGGGVIFYKKNAKAFLHLWKHFFYKYALITNGWDQASLRIASWYCDNSIYVLPPEFNVRGQHVRDKVRNLHLTEGGKQPIRHRILHWHGLNDPNKSCEAYSF